MALNRTKIDWARNPDGTLGYTWNPITGCLNHVNGLCKGGNFPCYAYRLAHGRLRDRYRKNWNFGGLTSELTERHTDPFYPRFWPERLYQKDSPRLWETKHKPKGIFACDMSDLFGIGIPENWTKEILHYIRCCPNDRFYLLTKQPQNLIKFSPFPDNCWVGVTATDNVLFHRARHRLEWIKAGLLYISFEPLLERIKIDWTVFIGGIKWVIIGAQTKPYKPPKIEWVQEIVSAADKAGIPVFLKDNLKPLWANDFFYPEWAMNKVMCTLRQEIQT